LQVNVQGKIVNARLGQTDFDEKIRQNIYAAAYDSKMAELRQGSEAELVRPMQSRMDYSVPAVANYVRRNVLPSQTPVLGNWTKIDEARYQGKPCYSVEVTVGLANQQAYQPRRFQFYLNGNKILWTDFEQL
jgi:hypothetical protein